ncbi:hypothetical protein MUN77_01605 [Leucobacter allii]|uniref:hypothetical protein n=1 Tax=Leucobacter allii TaxID=2932247 RepID=UPI001FD1C200|nr:hypothetical protein [Leucobacter allii]UOR02055.1 hypothetical protein MUN77_01605 [Leucobacter allii]
MAEKLIRYTAQRVGTNEWLHYDLEFDTDGPEFVFSSYETMTATISPELYRRIADDGHPMLWKWGTWIHAETPDDRIWTGIVDDVYADGPKLTVSVREWQGYLHGHTLTTTLWGVDADPADLVRELFAHLATPPNGLHGVEVVGSTPVRVGTESDDLAAAAKAIMDERKAEWDVFAVPRKALEATVKKKSKPFDREITVLNRERRALADSYAQAVADKLPIAEIAARKALVSEKDGELKAKRAAKAAAVADLKDEIEDLTLQEGPLKDAYDAAREDYDAAKKVAQEDGGAWKSLAGDTPDCWKVLQDLAAAGPFEFTTETVRTTGAPILRLHLHYTTTGRVRDDLAFEQGRNIIVQPKIGEPEDYASEVIALGAGEGSGDDEKTLRVVISEDDPRLLRNHVYSDPSITKLTTLRANGRAELARLRAPLIIDELTVVDIPNTPIGSWAAGDIITVKMRSAPHVGRVAPKLRIRSWKRVGTHKATLRLEAVDG